jgi:hypothetical protein
VSGIGIAGRTSAISVAAALSGSQQTSLSGTHGIIMSS